jgi:hypothetical protein
MRIVPLPVLILLTTFSVPVTASSPRDLRHHQQGRPTATAVVRPGWRHQREENRYVSPDGSSWFVPHAAAVGSEPIAVQMDRIARRDGEQVTYLRREADWIAVSGFKAAGYFTERLSSHAAVRCGITLNSSIPQSGSSRWILLCIARHTALITPRTIAAKNSFAATSAKGQKRRYPERLCSAWIVTEEQIWRRKDESSYGVCNHSSRARHCC